MKNDEYFSELAPKVEMLTALSTEALYYVRASLVGVLQRKVFIFLHRPVGAST